MNLKQTISVVIVMVTVVNIILPNYGSTTPANISQVTANHAPGWVPFSQEDRCTSA